MADPIPNASYPTPGQGLVLDVNGQLHAIVQRTLPGYEISYTEVTSSVTVASTTEATGTTLLSPAEAVFDGGPVMVEFFCYETVLPTVAAAFLVASLFEGTTQVTRLIVQESPVAAPSGGPVVGRYRFTPTAGPHTYKVTGIATSLTGSPGFQAGTGGAGGAPPMFVRFTKA